MKKELLFLPVSFLNASVLVYGIGMELRGYFSFVIRDHIPYLKLVVFVVL